MRNPCGLFSSTKEAIRWRKEIMCVGTLWVPGGWGQCMLERVSVGTSWEGIGQCWPVRDGRGRMSTILGPLLIFHQILCWANWVNWADIGSVPQNSTESEHILVLLHISSTLPFYPARVCLPSGILIDRLIKRPLKEHITRRHDPFPVT